MNYATYYRNDYYTAWRFTTLRSGQLAASDRSCLGGLPHPHTHSRTSR
jgi:hypothetical protein